MAIGAIMSSALGSLIANQLALSVASNNISNANDTDYTRQRLLTTPAGPDGGTLGIGMGVNVIGVDAIRNGLIETRLRQENSAKSGADTLANGLQGVENLFNDTNNDGLLKKITDFFNGFQTLSQDPASLNSREQLKITANAMIDALHSSYQDLKQVQTDADKAITADVGQINILTKQIAAVTQQINLAEANGPAPDLRDRRSALVKQLSSYIDVNELESGHDYQLTTKNNHLLVLNNTSKDLTTSDVDSNIGDGSIKAELDMRDTYVPKYVSALDQLAYEIQGHVNTIHSAGYDLDGNTNINFFAPLASATGASRLIALDPAVAGDSRKIAGTAAMQLGNLLHDPVFTGGSLSDQYGTLIYTVGSDVASAKSSMNEHDQLLAQLQNRRQAISGVSIDEESIQILQFQRSYQASARMLKAVDELLQVTLGIGA
jgi:flagellar hook-associated protein 1 FlgK